MGVETCQSLLQILNLLAPQSTCKLLGLELPERAYCGPHHTHLALSRCSEGEGSQGGETKVNAISLSALRIHKGPSRTSESQQLAGMLARRLELLTQKVPDQGSKSCLWLWETQKPWCCGSGTFPLLFPVCLGSHPSSALLSKSLCFVIPVITYTLQNTFKYQVEAQENAGGRLFCPTNRYFIQDSLMYGPILSLSVDRAHQLC